MGVGSESRSNSLASATWETLPNASAAAAPACPKEEMQPQALVLCNLERVLAFLDARCSGSPQLKFFDHGSAEPGYSCVSDNNKGISRGRNSHKGRLPALGRTDIRSGYVQLLL